MPATIIVNKLTVVHAKSSGISIAFPDVCKTPTPGGPVPIPYPNIAQSTDTAKGSSTVKMDGNPIMLKGSNFKMSTGDEAGSAMGVVSNKIKGKAEFTMYSFDVKVDGKNVCRLADPMQQNMGSPGNAFSPAEIQAANPPGSLRHEPCKQTENKREKTRPSATTMLERSGIIPAHQNAIQNVADDEGIILYFRKTNPDCAKWIEGKHQPKPHSLLKGKTLSSDAKGKDLVIMVQRWLDRYHRQVEHSGGVPPDLGRKPDMPRSASDLFGVVVNSRNGEPRRGSGCSSQGVSYKGKWITGDYDLFDLMEAGDSCQRPKTTAEEEKNRNSRWSKIKTALNKAMGWDGIQHGPQAHWEPPPSELKGLPPFSMPEKMKDCLNDSTLTESPQVKFAKDRPPMKVIDTPLTVIAGKNVVIFLDSFEEAKNALICCGCAEV